MFPKNRPLYILDPYNSARGHHESFGLGLINFAKSQGVEVKFIVSDEYFPQGKLAEYNVAYSLKGRPKILAATHVRRKDFNDINPVKDQFISLLKPLSDFITKDDILWDYFLWNPFMLIAYAEWLKSIPIEKRPLLILNLDMYKDTDIEWLEPYRPLVQELKDNLVIASAGIGNIKRLENDLGVPVTFMPRSQKTPARSRKKQNKVAFVANNSAIKSFDLMPEIIQKVFKQSDINFSIVLREIKDDPIFDDTCDKLYELKKQNPGRIDFIKGYMTFEDRLALQEESKATVHCYSNDTYFTTTPTASVLETLQQDTFPISLIGSSTDKEFKHFGIDIPLAKEQTTEAITETLLDICNNYSEILEKTKKGREKFYQFQSHSNLLNILSDLRNR